MRFLEGLQTPTKEKKRKKYRGAEWGARLRLLRLLHKNSAEL
jgi:hypothetical protein